MLFDSHAHYDDEKYDQDRYEVIESAKRSGVSYILNASCNIASAVESIALSQEFDFIYTAVGIHPHAVGEMNTSTICTLMDFAANEKVVAIGEIGLDYYYDHAPREVQRHWFVRQIDIAKQLKLPIIVHDRDAHEDVLRIVKEENASTVGGVFHCYSGSVEMLREVLNENFYISLAGPVTFKNAKKLIDVIKYVPEDRLLIETDCPYLAPEPNRGKRNDSRNLKYIAEKIAEVRGKAFEEIAEMTTNNTKRLFGIK